MTTVPAPRVPRPAALAALQAALGLPRRAAFVVRGRRQVGKSTLLGEFVATHRGPAVFWEASLGETAAGHRRSFQAAAAAALGAPELAAAALPDWKAILGLCLGLAATRDRRLVVVLDEFPWAAAADPTLPSQLKQMIDRDSADARLLVVLAGSSVAVMEHLVSDRGHPLHGRIGGELEVEPFTLAETHTYLAAWPGRERTEAHLLTGGLPGALSYLQPDHSFAENLVLLFLEPTGAYALGRPTITEMEVAGRGNLTAVFSQLLAGVARQKDLVAATGLAPREVVRCLDFLVTARLAERREPLGGAGWIHRSTRYEPLDAMLLFRRRFALDYTPVRRVTEPARAYFERTVAPQLPAWWGGRFEHLCRRAHPLVRAAGGVRIDCCGAYWSEREVQFDVVALRHDGHADIGECKWGAVPAAETLAGLQARLARFPFAPGREQRAFPVLYLAGRPRSLPPGEAVCFTLEDLLAAGA